MRLVGGLEGGGGAGKLLRAAVRCFLGGIDGSGAFDGAALGNVGAFIGAPGARWSVGRRGLGRCFGWPVRWLRELGVLPRRPVRPRPRTLPARLGARLTCLLRCGLGAPEGFVRRRARRASVDEGTAVADTRSAARRAASALLARGSGRRGSGPWSSEVVFVIGLPGRSHTAASRCPSDPAWGSLVKTLAARWYRLRCV